jgi:ubiquinone biosynthesis protein
VVSLLSTVRDIERLRQIVLVLGRHGFGEIVERSGLGRLVKRRSVAPGEDLEATPTAGSRQSFGPRLRTVLEDLGPTFVKLGQILSTRPDLIPADIILELKKLQDRVPPVDFAELKEEVQQELGAELGELFSDFDVLPLASASIAQVHRAQLKEPLDGFPADVVVKIQRPKIKQTVERDIELLYLLARALEQSIPEARIYSPVGLVTEFDRAMTAELDFSQEADHAERFARMFEGDLEACFPRVFRRASARKVLTLEYLPGKKLPEALEAGHSPEKLSKLALRILFKQIYEEGFFHGDPHPGNILILGTPEAPVFGLIDLGLVGRLSPQLRDKTVDLMMAAVRQDSQGVADALYSIGVPTKRIHRQQYDAEVTVLAEKYLGKNLRDIQLSAMIRDLVNGAVKYGLEIPPEFLMLGRTLMTIEGVGKEIYPELDVFEECKPFFARMVARRYSPERLSSEALRAVARISGPATAIPSKLDDALDDLLRGNLALKTHDPTLAPASDLLGRRFFSGLIVAALIGGACLLLANSANLVLGYVMLGVAAVWVIGHQARAWLAGRAIKRSTAPRR